MVTASTASATSDAAQPASPARPQQAPATKAGGGRKAAMIGGSAVVVAAIAGGAYAWSRSGEPDKPAATPAGAARDRPASGKAKGRAESAASPAADPAVELSDEQRAAIGLKTVEVSPDTSPKVSIVPGRVAPNEYEYAFITPRAPGVVRSVTAQVGQEVKAGQVLATIDSPDVGVARLDLYTSEQTLEVARSQADWQETIYTNTLDLISYLKRSETPEKVHDAFTNRAVGENRERLMTAYAQFRLAQTTLDRNRDLFAQKLITPKDFDQVVANFEVARSTYQSLMDQMGYDVRLANIRAQQARRQAETATRAARERLRILGVRSDGSEPPTVGGKVVGTDPLNPTPPGAPPATSVPSGEEAVATPAGGTPTPPDPRPVIASSNSTPVSTYSIWAPFDGTILDRDMIVPGVAVDTTHRLFTLADLGDVWVEASVHESDFGTLDRMRSRGGKVRFRTSAYPDKVFEGKVIYTGDLVEEKSRTVKVLAQAENPDRLLRPGMFVEVEVMSPRLRDLIRVPESAILTEADHSFVYVEAAPGRFERRVVDADVPFEGLVPIRKGLDPGARVVSEGGYKLRAMAVQMANAAD